MSDRWRAALIQRQADLKASNLWRQRRELQSAQQPAIELNDTSLLNFSSNDYLGLANHPQLIALAQSAVADWGIGSGASHLVCGHQRPHHQLESALAEFVGAERALLFSTGYMANLALSTALCTKHDLILQDKLNHASLIDGARLSQALFKRYRHNDVEHAQTILAQTEYQNALIMTDGVFSMDGDIAPLAQLKEIADQTHSVLVVDDAHGLGCVGDGGCGSLALSNLKPCDNVLLMGTLGKAVGSFGAFVAGDALYIEQLIQTARSYIYTTALPPSVAAASKASIELIANDGNVLRQRLNERIHQFKDGVARLGLELMPSDTAVQPLVLGDEAFALAFSERLYQAGFMVTAIRPPTVPAGSARLRFTFSATHTSEQVAALLVAIDDVSAQLAFEFAS